MALFFMVLYSIFFSGIQTAHAGTINSIHLSPGENICIQNANRLFQHGKTNEAITLVEEYINKKSAGVHYYIPFLLGNYYLSLVKNNQEAEDKIFINKAILNYRKAVQSENNFSEGWLNLATSLYESKNFSKAANAFEKGYKTSQFPNPDNLYFAAISYFQAEIPKKSLEIFSRKVLISSVPEIVQLSPAMKFA